MRPAAIVLALTLGSSPAKANGRFPSANQLVVHPTDPDTLVVRATYGIVASRDAGTSWGWLCEEALGFSGTFDPAIALTASGVLVAGLGEGLSVAEAPWCEFAVHTPGEKARYVVDVTIDRTKPNRVLALTSDSLGNGTFENLVFDSADGGSTLDSLGALEGNDLFALTIDVAPSDPSYVYVSALGGSGNDYEGMLFVSKTGGDHFERFLIPGTSLSKGPYIAALAPNDPAVVYVRLDGDGSPLLVSKNGGESFESIFREPGLPLRGFALSPDGSKIAVGGDGTYGGVWVGQTTTYKFEKVSTLPVQCLTWSNSGLYACMNETTQPFSVGLSKDEGKTFEPVYRQGCLQGTLHGCGPDSSVQKKCSVRWADNSRPIVAGKCGDEPSGGGSAAGGGGSPNGAEPDKSGSTSSCGMTRSGSGPSFLVCLAFFALAATKRRARRPH